MTKKKELVGFEDFYLKATHTPLNARSHPGEQDVYKIGGIGTVPVGRVETGILNPKP